MPPITDPSSVAVELRAVRRAGVVRLHGLALPELRRAAEARSPDGTVEGLLRLAVALLDAGTLRTAAEYTLGLAQGTRDWPAADRRRRAAEVYGVSVERFRKAHEVMVLGQVAETVARLLDAPAPADAVGTSPGIATGSPGALVGSGDLAYGGGRGPGSADGGRTPGTRPGAGGSPAAEGDPRTHRSLEVRAGGRTVRLTLHVHPVDLLRDVDVVVSPVNTHLALPEPYKSSVSASLRRAASLWGVTGDVLDDPVHDELLRWKAHHGTSGRPVLPGTVAATGTGALAAQGVRRIYHAAVAVPRAGTNDYDVLPADVTRAATQVFAGLARESARFDPPLRSVCFPLLGAGRGGLPYRASIAALWPAVEAELSRGAAWDLHFVVRGPAAAGVLERLLTGTRPARDPSTTGRSG
ncbi:hypothetical protein [Streptomyces sp. NPDC008121]|uniref:hypothetical protein n=1 Tax=Streptomyces sp. NPDC008121 TaxID=3364809 RepID=UPI0036E5F2C9